MVFIKLVTVAISREPHLPTCISNYSTIELSSFNICAIFSSGGVVPMMSNLCAVIFKFNYLTKLKNWHTLSEHWQLLLNGAPRTLAALALAERRAGCVGDDSLRSLIQHKP
jgi:hypothetical protein